LDSPEVRKWAAAQTAHALSHVRATDAGPRLLARMEALEEFWSEPPAGPPEERPERTPLLVDPKSLAPGEPINGVWASPDGQYAAYSLTRPASDRSEGRIRRVADGVDLEERLTDIDEHAFVWSRDARGFFYGGVTRPAPGGVSQRAERAVYYHVAGTPQSSDV